MLFSDTLQRALKNEMVTQEMIDFYEPSLMFAIPRLAIVYGLLVSPLGPLNVDKSSSDFPELFLPFKNLLRKIRELLNTLAPHEVLVLEMLLCQHEEPANISTKLKEVERMLEAREKSEVSAQKLQEKLTLKEEEEEDEGAAAPKESVAIATQVLEGVLNCAVNLVETKLADRKHRHEAEAAAARAVVVEIDCTEPEIRISPRRRSSSAAAVAVVVEACTSEVVASSSSSVHSSPLPPSSPSTTAPPPYSPRPRQRLKRHNAKRDSRRIPLRYQKDRRAKFKSTDDLLHRLYVCISGAADQLQSNYAGDFRAILKNVFIINVSPDDEPAEEEEVEEDEDIEDKDEADKADEAAAAEGNQVSRSLPNASSEFPVDLGTDALTQEVSNSLYQDLRASSGSNEDLVTRGATAASDAISSYALNLDMQLAEHTAEYEVAPAAGQEVFFQPEPTLLDIADGDPLTNAAALLHLPVEAMVQEAEFVIGTPPRWMPDVEAPACMGCQDMFSLFKRRHHCR